MKFSSLANICLFSALAYAAPVQALDKASTKCTPWMIGQAGQRIMFETLTDDQNLTPDMLTGWKIEEGSSGIAEILLEGGLSVSSTMGGTPDGFSEEECADFEIHVAANGQLAPIAQSERAEDRQRRERARDRRERRDRERRERDRDQSSDG